MLTATKLFKRAALFLDLVDEITPTASTHEYTFVSDEWFSHWMSSAQYTVEECNYIIAFTDEYAIWLEKWFHVLEEMELRHGPYPAGITRDILHSEPFPNFASELADRAARKMSSLALKQGDAFIKFGKPDLMEKLYKKGMLRLQPASFFANKEHNGAVRDDELSLDVSLALSRDDIVKIVRNFVGLLRHSVVRFERRTEARTFLEQNRNAIMLAVVTSIISGAIGFGFAKLNNGLSIAPSVSTPSETKK